MFEPVFLNFGHIFGNSIPKITFLFVIFFKKLTLIMPISSKLRISLNLWTSSELLLLYSSRLMELWLSEKLPLIVIAEEVYVIKWLLPLSSEYYHQRVFKVLRVGRF